MKKHTLETNLQYWQYQIDEICSLIFLGAVLSFASWLFSLRLSNRCGGWLHIPEAGQDGSLARPWLWRNNRACYKFIAECLPQDQGVHADIKLCASHAVVLDYRRSLTHTGQERQYVCNMQYAWYLQSRGGSKVSGCTVASESSCVKLSFISSSSVFMWPCSLSVGIHMQLLYRPKHIHGHRCFHTRLLKI